MRRRFRMRAAVFRNRADGWQSIWFESELSSWARKLRRHPFRIQHFRHLPAAKPQSVAQSAAAIGPRSNEGLCFCTTFPTQTASKHVGTRLLQFLLPIGF
jgi:hypothetical protein